MMEVAIVSTVVQLCVFLGEKYDGYARARSLADEADRPLLNIGCPRLYPLGYPCGDVCLDISRMHLANCHSPRPILGDIRSIPFPNGYFGAAFASHVLEHLHSVADGERALSELRRVSNNRIIIVGPHRYSINAWLNPDHYLWVDVHPDGSIKFVQRTDPFCATAQERNFASWHTGLPAETVRTS